MIQSRAPKLFRVRTENDLTQIPFHDGMAALELPAHMLKDLPIAEADRGTSSRLTRVMTSIRSKGYQPMEPIVVRVGAKGEWIVVNGGHRLTAAKLVMQEFWPNLFGPRVETLYFVLFADGDSWRDVGRPTNLSAKDLAGDVQAAQQAWERSEQRNHAANPGLIGR